MKTATIRRILVNKKPSLSGHYLYLVEAKGTILYVGQAQTPRDRLREHLGLMQGRSSSHLGMVVLANLPSSLRWHMQFFTLEDCRPYVQRQLTYPVQLGWYNTPGHIRQSIDDAELSLIKCFSPCLNVLNCSENMPLPAGIRNELVKLEEAHLVLWKLLRGQRVVLPQSAFLREQMDKEISENIL